jgi:hypothetical protein
MDPIEILEHNYRVQIVLYENLNTKLKSRIDTLQKSLNLTIYEKKILQGENSQLIAAMNMRDREIKKLRRLGKSLQESSLKKLANIKNEMYLSQLNNSQIFLEQNPINGSDVMQVSEVIDSIVVHPRSPPELTVQIPIPPHLRSSSYLPNLNEPISEVNEEHLESPEVTDRWETNGVRRSATSDFPNANFTLEAPIIYSGNKSPSSLRKCLTVMNKDKPASDEIILTLPSQERVFMKDLFGLNLSNARDKAERVSDQMSSLVEYCTPMMNTVALSQSKRSTKMERMVKSKSTVERRRFFSES